MPSLKRHIIAKEIHVLPLGKAHIPSDASCPSFAFPPAEMNTPSSSLPSPLFRFVFLFQESSQTLDCSVLIHSEKQTHMDWLILQVPLVGPGTLWSPNSSAEWHWPGACAAKSLGASSSGTFPRQSLDMQNASQKRGSLSGVLPQGAWGCISCALTIV